MASLLLPVLLLASIMAATAADSLSVIAGCPASCGGVEIPYPFGIGVGTGCSRKGFEILCINNGSAGEIPVLPTADQSIRVLNLSVSPFPEARVLLPVAWQCFNSTGDITGSYTGDVNFNPEGVYRISNTQNELFVLGCNTFIYASGVRWHTGRYRYKYYAGCVAFSNDTTGPRDGSCESLGCCRVDIPPGFTDTTMTMSTGGSWSHADQEFCPCDYAFIVEKGSYTFKASDLLSTHIPKPSNKTMPLSVDWTMPLRLDWAIRDNGSTTSVTCAQAANKPAGHEYACRSNNSECVDSKNGPGYFCNCTKGYEGNPYVGGGCSNINECKESKVPCGGGTTCHDTQGGYECKCKFGLRGDGYSNEGCQPIFPGYATAIVASFSVFVVACFFIMEVKRRKQRRFFDKNGGEILKSMGINIFTEQQLKKITKGYKKSIGEGAFGKVYKGIIDGDNTQQVAVKCATVKGEALPQEEFVNEITFQFRISHANLVRLIGCCLETDVPMLVFEFIPKGSLYNVLHGADDPYVLSLQERLDIGIGSAEALSYMHSHGGHNHVHGDIKSGNILLDNDFTPKVSDFGSSKLVCVASMYSKWCVSGDMSYIDPVYIKSGRFTEKSDVYSFGVVLLELITRRKAKDGDNSLPLDFVKCCKEEGNGRKLYDKGMLVSDDSAHHHMECLDRVGALAVRCLKEDVNERPTMAEVLDELKQVKAIATGGSGPVAT